MSEQWFESVEQARRRAARRVPASVFGALKAGADAGISLRDNTEAFGEIGLRPVSAGQPAERDLGVRVMGDFHSMPVLISPTGVQAVHPLAEVAVARAAASRGVGMGLSSFASKSLDEVIAAQPVTYFQMYWAGDRDRLVSRLERARSAGARGIILTLDWSFVHSRDWGSPKVPSKLDFATARAHALEVAARPRWLWQWLRSGSLPTFGVPNMAVEDRIPGFFEAYGEWMTTPPPTWEDVAWLRSNWSGPFMVKGVGRADEARRAVDAGVSAISVSNHGGNNLDGAPAPIRVLPEVARAVRAAAGTSVDVVMDGGVRRGSDVVKAIALGAQAVMIGRAYLWGLAANGQAGVENVLDVLRSGIDSTMLGLGKSSLAELTPDDVVLSADFEPCGTRRGD